MMLVMVCWIKQDLVVEGIVLLWLYDWFGQFEMVLQGCEFIVVDWFIVVDILMVDILCIVDGFGEIVFYLGLKVYQDWIIVCLVFQQVLVE